MITFLRASKHLGITHLTAKFVKTPKKSAIFDHMLLDCSEKSFHNLSALSRLSKESNTFKLQLNESLLMLCDKCILNKNTYLFPWNCLIDYRIVTFIIAIVIFVIPWQCIIIIIIK